MLNDKFSYTGLYIRYGFIVVFKRFR